MRQTSTHLVTEAISMIPTKDSASNGCQPYFVTGGQKAEHSEMAKTVHYRKGLPSQNQGHRELVMAEGPGAKQEKLWIWLPSAAMLSG